MFKKIKKYQIIQQNKKNINDTYGFGIFRKNAIDLLQLTCKIFDEYEIKYCLISGTLLGYVRHNDFIPWDDDIDLLVENKINMVMNDILKKYGKEITFIIKNNYYSKICLKNIGIPIKNKIWEKYITDQYNFPFIDLFVYTIIDNNTISFFDKTWDISMFLPFKKTFFLGITVYIPLNSHYFLSLNYGNNYLIEFKLSNWSHTNETNIINPLIKYDKFIDDCKSIKLSKN
jgi:phosphorylcholine metabolism protein LicD